MITQKIFYLKVVKCLRKNFPLKSWRELQMNQPIVFYNPTLTFLLKNISFSTVVFRGSSPLYTFF